MLADSMKIDVAVITKNSGRILEKCLDSVYKEIPVNNLIVVDGGSSDRTIEVLNGFEEKFENVRLLKDGGTRATARQKCIDNVETEWFAFVDSDVILCEDWFGKAMKYAKGNVGAVWGVNLDIIPNFNSKLFYDIYSRVSKECFKIRGGTHDTLILLDAVKNIRIPAYLHYYEDAFILDHIKRGGYDVIIADDIYCRHFRPSSDWEAKAILKDAYNQVKYGLLYSHKFTYSFFYPFHILHGLIQFEKNLDRRARI